MAAGFYTIGLFAGIGLVVVAVRAWGDRPPPLRVAVAGIGGLAFTLLFLTLTVILNREGNASRVPLVLGLGAWALLASVRPAGKALLSSVALFIYCLGLAISHLQLATSSRYSDHPAARLASVRAMRRSAARDGRPGPPEVEFRPEWHTWITGLYGVE